MAIDRQGTGLAITRVCMGVFFLAEGLSKYRWFTDSSMLAGQLSGWAQNAAPVGSAARAASSPEVTVRQCGTASLPPAVGGRS